MPSRQTRQAAPGPAAQKFEHKNTRVSSAHNSDAMAMASRAAHRKESWEQSVGNLTLKAPFKRLTQNLLCRIGTFGQDVRFFTRMCF